MVKKKPEKVATRFDGSGYEALLLSKDGVQDILITLLSENEPPEAVTALHDFLEAHIEKLGIGLMLKAHKHPNW